MTAAVPERLISDAREEGRAKPTVILADELTLVREGLVALCQGSSRCEVIGQCSDGSVALSLIQRLRPDIAVLDLNLSGLFTLELIRQLRMMSIPTRVIVLSTRSDRKTILEVLRHGAAGFLLKSGPSSELMDAFDHVMNGGVYVSPVLEVEKIHVYEKNGASEPFDTLSPREFQVFSLLVEGIRAKEIAARLGLSPKTVDTYRASLMHKLEIYDVAGLVRFAIHRDFISPR